VEVHYQVRTDAQGRKLVRVASSLSTGEEKEEVLLEACSRIQFSYPYRQETGEILWKETWQVDPETAEFPKWVKAEIFQEEQSPPWLQLFVLPRGSLTEESVEETEE